MLAAQLLLEPGDRVVAITPLWPNLTEILASSAPASSATRCR